MFTQFNIELERDLIRAKYNGKYQVMLPDSSKLFDTEAEIFQYLESQNIQPVLNTKKIDGNYCIIDC